jgi:hypothetical protein
MAPFRFTWTTYLDHFVSARIAKYTDGTDRLENYRPEKHEHRARSKSIVVQASGEFFLPSMFSPILQKVLDFSNVPIVALMSVKNTSVSETTEFRETYHVEAEDASDLSHMELPIIRYRGKLAEPRWMDTEPGKHIQLAESEP